MRQPLYGTPNSAQLDPIRAQPEANGYTVPAPVGGWNARDPLAGMKPTDAIFLNNFYPTPSQVAVRPGCALWESVPVNGNPLLNALGYAGADGSTKLFGTTNQGIYDLSTGGGGTQSTIAYALTSGQVQAVNFVNSGNTYLWGCNGQDPAFYYSSAAGWTAATITGVSSSSISNVSVYQSRLMLIPKRSMSFWYLGLNAIQGAASEFPMGSFFTLGGYLVASDTWTYTTIMGVQKYFCIITSQGEVAVYSGNDPSLSTNWSLVGIYYVGVPVGNRPFVRVGTDLCVMTANGLVPMSKAVQSATDDRSIFYTDKIQPAFATMVQSWGGNYGWKAVLFPSQTALIVNVPLTTAGSVTPISNQIVMNTQSGSWCLFTGWNASDFLSFNSALYFTSGYSLYQAWTGTSDAGVTITAQAKTAFNMAGSSNLKHVSLVRPIFTSNMAVQYQLGLDMDFDNMDFSPDVDSSGLVGGTAVWDQAVWDQAVWASSNTTSKTWQTVPNNSGIYFALRLQILASGGTFSWSATNYLLQVGGQLG